MDSGSHPSPLPALDVTFFHLTAYSDPSWVPQSSSAFSDPCCSPSTFDTCRTGPLSGVPSGHQDWHPSGVTSMPSLLVYKAPVPASRYPVRAVNPAKPTQDLSHQYGR